MIHTGDYIRLAGKVPGDTKFGPNDIGPVIDDNPSQRGYVKAIVYSRGDIHPTTLLISSDAAQAVTSEHVSKAVSEFKFRNLERERSKLIQNINQ